MFQFPVDSLLYGQERHDFIMDVLHPHGLTCPNGHSRPPEQVLHDHIEHQVI